AFLPACYGIVQVPTGPWFCRKCESQERAARVRCELCPHKDGALKRTDNGGWAHVVCALYIPEVQFANVLTMEPIVLQYVPHDRFNKTCYICEEQGRESKAASGACMACNRHGCRQAFHVTCAQMAGLLCEEEVLEVDNVKYCGYCKYHFNKMKTSRHSGGSSFIAGRRSRSTSPAQEKHVSHHERPKKSRKDKERPKQKHKKRPESPTSLTPSSVPVAAEKGSTSHHEGSKEASEVGRSEVKGKKSSSHGSSHKGKKTGSGKSSVGFSSASSSGTFQPAGPGGADTCTFGWDETAGVHLSCLLESIKAVGGAAGLEEDKDVLQLGNWPVPEDLRCGRAPVALWAELLPPRAFLYLLPLCLPPGTSCSNLQCSQDFVTFPKLEQDDEKYRKPVSSSSSSHCSPLYEGQKGDIFEQKVIFSGFGSIMRFSTSAVSQQRGRDASPVDYKASNPVSGPSVGSSGASGSSSSHKRMPSLSHRRGAWLSNTSPPLAGIYTSNKDPISHGGGVLRAVCSTPLSSSLLAHQGTSSLPQLNRSPFASTIPASSSSVSTTQVFSLAGSTFSLPSSHIFGSPLASGLSINPLLNQSESSRAEPDLEDCSFGCRGTSPQESLSSMSPISSLPTLFDQTVSCSSSGQLENVPQATPNIEQLLEKQGNGEAGVNIVEMLKALHSLQKENQRLQEQIMTLTAKKERLQLLNVQLSVPFPVVTSSNGPGSQAQYILPPNVCNNDSLSVSKSPPCKNSFGIENSLSTSSEDPHSGCPSRSSSSLSFHSTPPPLPMLQQSPASLPLPGVQQVNGLARVAGSGLGGGTTASHSLSTVPMVDGLMGTLAGGQQMPINGILGNLNGAQAAQPPSALTQASGPPTLQLSTSLSSMPSLSPLTEQQRHVLHQHEQQLQQLQQLLTSQPLNPEQQALVFQMMQQIQQKRELQRLQMTSSSQLSMTSLLAATSAPLHSSTSALMTSAPQPPPSSSSLLASLSPQQLNPSNALLAPQATPPLNTPGNSLLASGTGIPPVLTAQTNPFLNLQADGNTPKGTSMNEKGAPLTQDKG
ncbi:Protein AF-17, partial [Nipponia nippon]